jgi:hypothetical protein
VGDEELLLSGYRISIVGDENILEIGSGDDLLHNMNAVTVT